MKKLMKFIRNLLLKHQQIVQQMELQFGHKFNLKKQMAKSYKLKHHHGVKQPNLHKLHFMG